MNDYGATVRTHLIDEAVVAESKVFLGTEKPAFGGIPVDAVFVATYGGLQPESMFSNTEQIHQVLVQVLVRTLPKAESAGQTLANAIYDALRNAQPTGTMVIRPNSPPIRLPVDDQDRYRFSINVTVHAQE